MAGRQARVKAPAPRYNGNHMARKPRQAAAPKPSMQAREELTGTPDPGHQLHAAWEWDSPELRIYRVYSPHEPRLGLEVGRICFLKPQELWIVEMVRPRQSWWDPLDRMELGRISDADTDRAREQGLRMIAHWLGYRSLPPGPGSGLEWEDRNRGPLLG